MTGHPHLELFPIPIGHYTNPDWARDARLPVEDEVDKIAAQLTFFGAVPVAWDTPMHHRDDTAIMHRRTAWAASHTPYSLLYWVGHGWATDATATLAHAHSPNPIGENGISTRKLAETIAHRTAGEDDHWHIVVIDTCSSARFVQRLSADLDTLPGSRRVLLIGTSGDGPTSLGRFSTALERVLSGAYRNDRDIALWDFERELRRTLPHAEIILKRIDEHATLHRTRTLPLVGPVDVVTEIDHALSELTTDEQLHFIPKAQGAELGEQSWYFQGRTTESERIATWLRTGTTGLLTITGTAGCGKSALLGHLIVQSKPVLRTTLTRHGLITESALEQRPPDDVFDTVLHLAGMSLTGVVARLARDTLSDTPSATADTPAQITWLLRRIRDHGPLTVLADALDEATEPLTIARTLLCPLSQVDGVRVVVGTRRSTKENPDHPEPGDHDLLDALHTTPADTVLVSHDAGAITTYVQTRLTDAARRGLLPDTHPDRIRDLALAIGVSNQHFLFARLAVHEIQAAHHIPTGKDLEALLANTHRGLFAQAVTRLTRHRHTHGPILRTLAFARGRGIPVTHDITATAATALADTTVSTPDVHTLLHDAAPYVLVDREHDQTVYRLAHRTFAEHFTSETHPTQQDHDTHRAITIALTNLAASDDTPLNPYLTHYLSGHAAAAGQPGWETLAANTPVLDRLDPLTVTNDAMRTAFGHHPLPPAITGIIAASHHLATAPLTDRRGLRQMAMTQQTLITNPAHHEPPPTPGQWSVQWANLTPHHTHKTLTGHTGSVRVVVVVPMPDGRTLLATASTDKTVRLWDPGTGRQVGDPFTGHTDWVNAVVPMPDGRTLLATASTDKTVRLWDPGTGRQVGDPFTGHTDWVNAVVVVPMPDGRTLLATASTDKTVRLWDPDTGRQVGDPFTTGHTGRVRAVAAVPMPDGHSLLATGSDDRTVRLWDPTTGRQVGDPFTGHTASVRAVAAVPMPDSHSLLATSGDDRTVRLWDPDTGDQVCDPFATGHAGSVSAVVVVPMLDSRTLLATASDDDRTVRLWDPGTGDQVGDPFTGHTASVRAVAAVAMPDGHTLLATGGDDETVRLWDPGTDHRVGDPFTGHTGWVRAVAAVAMPDGHTLLATGGDDETVRLWDLTTGRQVGDPFTGHHGPVTAMAAVPMPDGRTLLATASDDRTVQVWDPATGHRLGDSLTGHTGWVRAVAAVAMPDGHTLLATGGTDGRVRLWDPATGHRLGDSLTGHTDWVHAVALVPMPDSHILLATASHDKTVRLWDPATGRQVGDPFTGHTDWVTAVAAVPVPDSHTLLATAGTDGTVRLWDPATGRQVGAPLTGHTGWVRAVTAVPMPDSHTLLATGGDDRTVRLWDPSTGHQIATFLVGASVGSLVRCGDVLVLAMETGVAAITFDVPEPSQPN